MASWVGFPLPFNKTDTTNSTSTSDVGFASLPLLSDGSGGNMQQYFGALPSSYPVAPECTENPNPSQNPSSVHVYNVGVDGCTSISGIESCQTLSPDRGMQLDEVAPVSNDVEPDELVVHAVEASVERESVQKFGHRTSQYRGVKRADKGSGKYQAYLWDNSRRKEGHVRKGMQVHLGGYDKEEKAARAYDLAALKYRGPLTPINFPLNNYEKELEEMKHMSTQDYIAHLRRNSGGFSKGASIYRGVSRISPHGGWRGKFGRVAGNKNLYLGTFSQYL